MGLSWCLMDKTGTILKMFWTEKHTHYRPAMLGEIYFNGEKTGSFEFPKSYYCYKYTLENGNVFNVGGKEDGDRDLFHWDLKGNLVNNFSLPIPKNASIKKIANE